MSVAQLIVAINNLAKEENSSLVAQHVRNIVSGVKEIGDRLAAIEKRLDALEGKSGR